MAGFLGICGYQCKCKKKCKSFFPLAPELEKGCSNLCKTGRTEFTKEEYLCSEYVPEPDVMRRYGYDPCPTSGITLQEYGDPFNDKARQDQQAEYERGLLEQVIIIGAGLLVLALIAFVIIRAK